ncbi:Gstt1 [Symbiodinium microadriaticum]|nr:Gstt1 [Symbiodinium microadriaticum]
MNADMLRLVSPKKKRDELRGDVALEDLQRSCSLLLAGAAALQFMPTKLRNFVVVSVLVGFVVLCPRINPPVWAKTSTASSLFSPTSPVPFRLLPGPKILSQEM